MEKLISIITGYEKISHRQAINNLINIISFIHLENIYIQWNIEQYPYNFVQTKDAEKSILLNLVKFSNLVNLYKKDDKINIKSLINLINVEILSQHELTKKLFDITSFTLKNSNTYRRIIPYLLKDDFMVNYHTFMGNDQGSPILKLLNIQSTDKILVPYSQAGQMSSYLLKYGHSPSKITIHTLGTQRLTLNNIFISTGIIAENVKDSLFAHESIQFNIVIMNIDMNCKYEHIKIDNPEKDKFIICKINDLSMLMLQYIIHVLEIGGQCIIKLDKIRKNNKQVVLIKQYLVKTCNVHRIILYGKKEYFIHFTKVKSVTSLPKYASESIAFVNYNEATRSLDSIRNININSFIEESCSFIHTDYIKYQFKAEGASLCKLMDICEIEKHDIVKDDPDGTYPIINKNFNIIGKSTSFNAEPGMIIYISGRTMQVNEKSHISSCFTINSKNKAIIENDYLSLYMKYNVPNVLMANSLSSVRNFKIFLPPMIHQLQSLERIKTIDDSINKHRSDILRLNTERWKAL